MDIRHSRVRPRVGPARPGSALGRPAWSTPVIRKLGGAPSRDTDVRGVSGHARASRSAQGGGARGRAARQARRLAHGIWDGLRI
jgi:hypothetical protein